MEQLYTIKEAAQILRVTPGAVYGWVEARQIGCVKVSGRWIRIPSSEIDAFIQRSFVPAIGGDR